jgi:hypothetical protein
MRRYKRNIIENYELDQIIKDCCSKVGFCDDRRSSLNSFRAANRVWWLKGEQTSVSGTILFLRVLTWLENYSTNQKAN